MPSIQSYGEYLEAARRAIDERSTRDMEDATTIHYRRWYQNTSTAHQDAWRGQIDRATSGPEAYIVDPDPARRSDWISNPCSEVALEDPQPTVAYESVPVDLFEELSASEPRPSGWSVRPVCRSRAQEVYHTKGVSPFKLLAIKESEINGDKSCV